MLKATIIVPSLGMTFDAEGVQVDVHRDDPSWINQREYGVWATRTTFSFPDGNALTINGEYIFERTVNFELGKFYLIKSGKQKWVGVGVENLNGKIEARPIVAGPETITDANKHNHEFLEESDRLTDRLKGFV